jgi:hypothetical protein
MFHDQMFRTVRMRVRARSESYNDVEKVKYNVLSMNAVDWAAASNDLVAKINALV